MGDFHDHRAKVEQTQEGGSSTGVRYLVRMGIVVSPAYSLQGEGSISPGCAGTNLPCTLPSLLRPLLLFWIDSRALSGYPSGLQEGEK